MTGCDPEVETKWISFLSKLLSAVTFIMASAKRLEQCVCVAETTSGGGAAPYLPGVVESQLVRGCGLERKTGLESSSHSC